MLEVTTSVAPDARSIHTVRADEQRERALFLVGQFMVWKIATSFVLTAETWLGAEVTRFGDEALLAVGVSRHERLAVVQRIRHGDAVGFSEPM
jgi:hypothetical protein